jgi:hypothetical protein
VFHSDRAEPARLLGILGHDQTQVRVLGSGQRVASSSNVPAAVMVAVKDGVS